MQTKKEFDILLAACNATHSEWCGAMAMLSALYQHLGSIGYNAGQVLTDQLDEAHKAAGAALKAYSDRERAFNTAAYEAQQRATATMQKAA